MDNQHTHSEFPPNRDTDAPSSLLRTLGISPSALLGQGGESWVYALDAERVARINRSAADFASVSRRTALLAELGRTVQRVPFDIPRVHETIRTASHIVTVESRLSGRPVNELLPRLAGQAREALVLAYLQAAARLGDLAVKRPWYGDLIDPDAVRAPTFRGYLSERARVNLARAGREFDRVRPAALAASLPEPAEPAFVHLDAFPGNMLAEGESITAVLDFGASTLIGDRRLDPLAAAVYLAPQITPGASEQDRVTAQAWLAERGLAPLFKPAQAWIAAYWSFARDDFNLYRWCQSVLHAQG